MIFSSKIFMFLLILAPVFAAVSVYFYKRYKSELEAFASGKMMPVVLGSNVYKKRKAQEIILVSSVILILLALAGPQFGTKLVSIKRKSVDVMIAVDCSKSMLARDMAPDRMSKAKDMLAVLVDRLKENRIGVIAFSGTAFTQCPLTFDYNSARMLLGMINTDLIPMPGTSIGSAIRLAVKSLGGEKSASKVLILLTDGEDHKSDPESAAQDAAEYGIRIFAVGIGTPQGEPIPENEIAGQIMEYKKNKKGQVVTSKLDEQLLSRIAETTGGKYYPMAYGDVGVAEQIYSDISVMEKTETKGGIYGIYEQRFQIPLLIAVVLLIIGMLVEIDLKFIPEVFKKSGLFLIAAALLLTAAGGASAGARGEIKKGNKFYKQGSYDEALEKYNDAGMKKPDSPEVHFNSGDVYYRQGDYESALREYGAALGKTKDKKLQSKIYYNMGNSAAVQEKTDDAVKNYKSALNLNPGDEDSKYNLGILLQQKAQSKQQKKDGKNKQDKKDEKDKQNKGGKQDKKEGKDKENKGKAQQDKQKEQGKKKEEKKKYMSKEDVERLMQMAGEQEKEAMRRKAKTAAPKLPQTEEDW